MKKIVALVLCLFLFFAFSVAVSADETMEISANNVSCEPGNEIDVIINLSKNYGINYLKLKLTYDDSVLTLMSVENLNVLADMQFVCSQSLDDLPFVIQWSSAGNLSGSGEIAKLRFKVNANAVAGNCSVNVNVDQCFNENDQVVPVKAVAGIVTIENKPECVHNWEWIIQTAATCTENGLKYQLCNLCSAEQNFGTVIESKGHNYGEWIETKVADCLADGEKIRYCQECDSIETEIVSKIGHDYSTEWTIDVEPTCIKNGVKTHHCVNCDSTIDETIVEASGHSFCEWIVVTPSTTDSDGLKKRTCEECGLAETEIIEKLPNENPEYMLGDVNSDGKVTAADARIALRAASKLETLDETAFLAADVNADNKINAVDARKILRVAASLEEF